MSSSSLTSSNPNHLSEEKSALQKHVEFFDINKDGIIYPWETFKGFRAIGSGLALSTIAAMFINMGLSRKTRPVSLHSAYVWMLECGACASSVFPE